MNNHEIEIQLLKQKLESYNQLLNEKDVLLKKAAESLKLCANARNGQNRRIADMQHQIEKFLPTCETLAKITWKITCTTELEYNQADFLDDDIAAEDAAKGFEAFHLNKKNPKHYYMGEENYKQLRYISGILFNILKPDEAP